MREGQLAELDAEAQLEKIYRAKRRDLEVRRAAILEAQAQDNEMRSAMAKAEKFMNFLKCSLMPKPVASPPVPAVIWAGSFIPEAKLPQYPGPGISSFERVN